MATTNALSEQSITQIIARLGENKRVRRNLPGWGRIHIDRQLPFLCVYRQPVSREDAGTERLITSQPAYVTASGQKTLASGISQLIEGTAKTMSGAFGGFLIVEIWSGLNDDLPDDNVDNLVILTEPTLRRPAFNIIVPKQSGITETVEVLEKELARLEIRQARADVNVIHSNKLTPPRMPALIPEAVANALGCVTIGIVIRPIFRKLDTGENLPLIHQAMIREFTNALQKAFFTFVRTQTKYRPPHYQMLGRHAMVKAVWTIDKQLSDISTSFDFLLQATPINAHSAWTKFKRQRFQQMPIFRYRPRTVDPALLKRQLWNIHIENVEDPTLQHLFREKRKELDTQISMLGNMNSDKFLYGSMELYGDLNDKIVNTARQLLEKISPHSRDGGGSKSLNAQEFAQVARNQIERYRAEFPDFSAQVYVQNNVTGLVVSHGNLLVGDKSNISASRVEALISHEIGTHIVTYFNGQAQPFKLLFSGLAGYEELQEGLAVLAEYLVGGLSKPRLRLLAARVVAAHSLIDGATFIDTFNLLTNTYRFKQRIAFNIVMRIYRAGGLTKDAVYLRGLVQLLQYLQKKPLADLFFIGKIAIDDIPIMQELQRRKVLQPPRILPHFLNAPATVLRLERLSRGISVIDLIERKNK
ncbi:MAG: flavohemoglobin expression-modulating QEGLA motif protein [Aggregatilineales bacterium]